MMIKVLFLLLSTTLSSQAFGSIHLSQDEQDYLKTKKEISVCISPKGLPLYGYEKGKNIGILADMMYLIEKKIPIPFHYIHTKTWEQCINLSKEKKVDIAAMVITAPNRHKHLSASHKVFEGYIGLATKIQEPLLNDLSIIRGKKVAFLKSQTSLIEFAKHKLPYFEYVMVDSIEEGLNLVAKGKIYGYVDDTYSLAYYILKLHSNELKVMEKINKKPLGVAVGVRKDEPALLSIINKAIDNIETQTFRDIIHHWIAVRVEKGFDYTLLIKIASVFLLILLVSLYWVRKLLAEVKKRKEAEEELKHFNENLEKEIISKIEEIHYKDTMLRERTKLAAMGEMLGAIAHQWRRPLSTLHINIEMLEQDYVERKIDKAFLDEYIEKNSDIIQYMSKTINDFQDFYKINKEKEFFDVMEKIDSVSDLQINQLEQNGISLIKEGETFTVFGYPSEFQQVILNLINNAKDALMEKEKKNAYIKIAVSREEDKGVIRVSDNAGGIDEKMLKKIFEPYFTTKEQNGGTGLGLYISKMIIEKNMQGELSISYQGDGSEVLISLKKEEDA